MLVVHCAPVRRRAALALLLAIACGPSVGGGDAGGTAGGSGSADSSGSDGADGTGGTGGPSDEPGIPILEVESRDLDILVVVDNSGSMGEEQAALALSLGPLIDLLERPDVNFDYRIGFTTTDDGNPWCQGTSPEGGMLRLTSCRSRPTEFVFEGAIPIDATQEACYDLCPEEWTNIEIQPTAVEFEGDEVPRPWMERIDGVTNLPEGITAQQAFQCFAPQGIDGCGFEAPLESMWKALRRSGTDDDPSFGFMRDEAALIVLVVTDEVDCSYNPAHETIFLPDGNRVFWSDTDLPAPTSAVCWNAGVACSGGAGTYDDCVAVDLDVDGLEVGGAQAEEQAVLRPVARYVDFLQTIEEQKQILEPDREVLVSVIAGVGSDGSVTYQDAADPQFQIDFGIGPGCSSSAGEALPPVRLRELAGAFEIGGDRNLYSVCEMDYSPALESIFETTGQVRPACMPVCVADTDPTTPDLVDPQCTLTERTPLGDGSYEDEQIAPCDGDQLPAGADVCYVALVGDEMDDYCIDRGHNLQFQLLRDETALPIGGTIIFADCEPSQAKAVDCPDLP